jgi:transposase-like protein
MNITDIIATNSNERKELFYNMVAYTALNTTKKLFSELLEAERDEVVGVKRYEQNQKRNDFRNGYSYKWYDTKWGRYKLPIPRTRKSGWTSKIVKKFATMDDKLIELVQYAVFSGISIRLAKPLIESLVGGYVSTARISNIIRKIDDDIALWKKSSIKNNSYEAVIIDGMWIKLWKGNKKRGKKQEKRVAITALGINKDETEVIDFEIAESESEENVAKLLRRIYGRGLKPENVDMFITDGAEGIENAIDLIFGNIPLQRCIMHKLGNLRSDLSDMPTLRPIIMEQAKNIFNADSLNSFLKRVDDFKESWPSLHEKKKNFEKNIEKCGTYFSVGSKYRTTGLIENKFRHLRRLTRVQSHYVNDKSAERYFYGQLLLREYIVPYQNFTQNT